MAIVSKALEFLRRFGQKFGPYLLLELLMPGGTLLALMLFLAQRRKLAIAAAFPMSNSGTADRL